MGQGARVGHRPGHPHSLEFVSDWWAGVVLWAPDLESEHADTSSVRVVRGGSEGTRRRPCKRICVVRVAGVLRGRGARESTFFRRLLLEGWARWG